MHTPKTFRENPEDFFFLLNLLLNPLLHADCHPSDLASSEHVQVEIVGGLHCTLQPQKQILAGG